MEILNKQIETSEGPAEITPENVQYWSHHSQEFAQTQIHKAKKFVEHQCYEYVGENLFRCANIPGYNTRVYTIKKNNAGEFDCNCQKGKDGDGKCSHILGLYYAFRLKYFQK
ncbi:hypothetical protein LCGC14_2296820 [marine sediment metagenome]|uniref:SWIM-type domain-containing protein n=1 Tax=marine sediment metagenome TaxID=412755 RepID=A0A0F9FJS6_9ZZZZ